MFASRGKAFFFDNKACTVLDATSGETSDTYMVSPGGCARVTANQELAFLWQSPGTQFFNLETGKKGIFGPMRPGCTDGVVTANGMLHWSPWHCACKVDMFGAIGLAPAQKIVPGAFESRLEKSGTLKSAPGERKAGERDWYMYKANNQGTAHLPVSLSFKPVRKWEYKCLGIPTAPVSSDGNILAGDSSGVVYCLDEESGRPKHKSYAGGKLYFPPTVWRDRYFFGSSDGWIYSHGLYSGNRIWRFRASPIERKIVLFGKISSTWPVRSNTLIQDGVVYASSGIHGYDGTYLYALNADTGDVKWCSNASSGKDKLNLMGQLLAYKDIIYVATGYQTQIAGFDMSTGERVRSGMPSMKRYSRILSASPGRWHNLKGGRDLYVLNDTVYAWGRALDIPQDLLDSYFGGIASSGKYVIARESRVRKERDWATPQQITCRIRGRAFAEGDSPVWKAGIADNRQIEGLVLTANAVVVIYNYPKKGHGGVMMVDASNGNIVWEEKLGATVVPWGIAVTRNKSIILSLSDNRIICFAAEQKGG